MGIEERKKRYSHLNICISKTEGQMRSYDVVCGVSRIGTVVLITSSLALGSHSFTTAKPVVASRNGVILQERMAPKRDQLNPP